MVSRDIKEQLMTEYLVHKAVNLDQVFKKLVQPLEHYEANYFLQWKYDGCNCIMEVGGRTLSRTGELMSSMGQVERLLEGFPQLAGMVVLGEAWHPTKDFSTASGEFRRFEESDSLWFVMFDCLTQKEFNQGYSDVPYVTRQARYDGVRVDNRLIPAHTKVAGAYKDAQAWAQTLREAGGYDGVILRDPLGTWKAGEGKTGEIIRIKPKLSFDLRVTQVFASVGEKTGRTVWTIEVDFKGRALRVGSGVPHNFKDLPKYGDIVEIEAMNLSSKGLLREPRFKSIRYDKVEADC